MDLDDQLLHYLIAGGAILLSHTVKACYDWVGETLGQSGINQREGSQGISRV